MNWQLATLSLFIGSTLFDLWALLQVSSGIGLGMVTIFQVATGGYAYYRLRKVDTTLLFYVDNQTKQNEPVVRELWVELLQLLGIYFLLIPGFLTDALGIVLLNNFSRTLLVEIYYFLKGFK